MFNLPQPTGLEISNLEGPHSGTFSYTKSKITDLRQMNECMNEFFMVTWRTIGKEKPNYITMHLVFHAQHHAHLLWVLIPT
jgi:hypothetical protein